MNRLFNDFVISKGVILKYFQEIENGTAYIQTKNRDVIKANVYVYEILIKIKKGISTEKLIEEMTELYGFDKNDIEKVLEYLVIEKIIVDCETVF